LNDEDAWKKFRLIAYETWRKGSKASTSPDTYLPIGVERIEMTEEELDELFGKARQN